MKMSDLYISKFNAAATLQITPSSTAVRQPLSHISNACRLHVDL